MTIAVILLYAQKYKGLTLSTMIGEDDRICRDGYIESSDLRVTGNPLYTFCMKQKNILPAYALNN